jgi:hypothetical protein
VARVGVDHADTGIGFQKRTQNARFLSETCKEHLWPMRFHRAVARDAP